MTKRTEVSDDVYGRYGLSWAHFPGLTTPSAHSDEVERYCARQSLAVYGVYPNDPFDAHHDYVPSEQRIAIEAGSFSAARMFLDTRGEESSEFESERGYRTVVTDKAGALLVWKSNHLVVAFRGTANWQDWIHNFTKGVVSPPTVGEGDAKFQLHKGFCGLAENIFPPTAELVGEFAEKRKGEVFVTLCGHSLGGALAVNFGHIWQRSCEAAYHDRYYYRYIPVRLGRAIRIGATYTFGAPRLGTGQIWEMVHRPHYRLVLTGDPVPRTPPGFSDDFQATFLNKRAIQPETAFGKISMAVFSKLFDTIGLDIPAHNIENYIGAVDRKIEAKSTTR